MAPIFAEAIGPFPFDQLGEIARTGLLGAICVLLLAYIWYLEKQRGVIQAARIADWKEIGEIVKTNNTVLATWTQANEGRTRAIEANARAQEIAAAAHTTLANEIALLRETVTEGIQSNRAMREALIQKGIHL